MLEENQTNLRYHVAASNAADCVAAPYQAEVTLCIYRSVCVFVCVCGSHVGLFPSAGMDVC